MVKEFGQALSFLSSAFLFLDEKKQSPPSRGTIQGLSKGLLKIGAPSATSEKNTPTGGEARKILRAYAHHFSAFWSALLLDFSRNPSEGPSALLMSSQAFQSLSRSIGHDHPMAKRIRNVLALGMKPDIHLKQFTVA